MAKTPLKNRDIEARLSDTAGGDIFEALTSVARKKVDGRRNWPASRVAREVARLQAVHVAKRKRLKAEAWSKRQANMPRRRVMPPYEKTIQARILRAMAPMCWHATADIVAAAGLGRPQRFLLFARMPARGLVVSRWDSELRDVCHGHKVRAKLWRLTRKGELEREALLLFGDEN